MRSSFALQFLYRESVINITSSCGWLRIFSFIFFNRRSAFCSYRIRAFALITFLEYDVVLPSIFVNSFTFVFKADGSSIAAHCFAICLDCCFRSKVGSSDSLFMSACVKKKCSTATSEEEVVTKNSSCLNTFTDF